VIKSLEDLPLFVKQVSQKTEQFYGSVYVLVEVFV